MESLLNKCIIVENQVFPRPDHVIALERKIGIKRDAELKLTQRKWEAYMDKLEQHRMEKLMKKLAEEQE
jgi:hypothetical protein